MGPGFFSHQGMNLGQEGPQEFYGEMLDGNPDRVQALLLWQ